MVFQLRARLRLREVDGPLPDPFPRRGGPGQQFIQLLSGSNQMRWSAPRGVTLPPCLVRSPLANVTCEDGERSAESLLRHQAAPGNCPNVPVCFMTSGGVCRTAVQEPRCLRGWVFFAATRRHGRPFTSHSQNDSAWLCFRGHFSLGFVGFSQRGGGESHSFGTWN